LIDLKVVANNTGNIGLKNHPEIQVFEKIQSQNFKGPATSNNWSLLCDWRVKLCVQRVRPT
jgi:hypothetical protein